MSSPFDQPAFYRITVASQLDTTWAADLHELAVTNHFDRQTCLATLTGRLPDQAALLSLLNMLYDSHITVLAVERLTEDWERLDTDTLS